MRWVGLSEAKTATAHAHMRDRCRGWHSGVRYRDYFNGRDKPSNEYPLKNGVREGTAKHYHADSGALMGESEYKNGVRIGRYCRCYFGEGGALMQEGFYKEDK